MAIYKHTYNCTRTKETKGGNKHKTVKIQKLIYLLALKRKRKAVIEDIKMHSM